MLGTFLLIGTISKTLSQPVSYFFSMPTELRESLCHLNLQSKKLLIHKEKSEVKPYKPDWLILPELIPVSVV